MKSLLLGLCFLTATLSLSARQTYALVVGIGDYQRMEPGQGDLNYTTKDALLFADFLATRAGNPVPGHQIIYLINEQATRANILGAVREIARRSTSEDEIVFYFSGHGVKNHLVPYEGTYHHDLLPYDDLLAELKKCAATTKWVVVDACHSDSIRPKKKQAAASSDTPSRPRTDNVILMVSSQSYQKSTEYGLFQQGLFSYFLIDGLRGHADADEDGQVTVRELHYHIEAKVKGFSKGFQEPQTFGVFDQNYVLARAEVQP